MFRKNFLILFLILFILTLLVREASAFYFSISLDPQQGTINKGGTLKTAINIYSASSDWENSWEGVSFFGAVEPKGLSINFYPYYCRPPCSSIMTISVSQEAESKNYSIPVVATGKGVTQKATYYFTVNPLTQTTILQAKQDLLASIQAQINAIRIAILRLKEELRFLVSSGAI